MQLAEVGDPGVGREVRLQANHPVQRARRRSVATELDLGVGEGRVRAAPSGARAAACLPGEPQASAEVVAGQREGGLAGDRRDVPGVPLSAAVEGAVGARVVAGIARLASALVVGVAEQRVAAGVARGPRGPRLEAARSGPRCRGSSGWLARLESHACQGRTDDGPDERLTRARTPSNAAKTTRGGVAHLTSAERAERRDRPRHWNPRRLTCLDLHLCSSVPARLRVVRPGDGAPPSGAPSLPTCPADTAFLLTGHLVASAGELARTAARGSSRTLRSGAPGTGTWTGTSCRSCPPRPRAAPCCRPGIPATTWSSMSTTSSVSRRPFGNPALSPPITPNGSASCSAGRPG